MKKHGPMPGNKPNPWFSGQVKKRRKKTKQEKKSRRENR